MSKRIEASLTRIHRSDGIIVGMGVLFQEKLILSCCHVINAALGKPGESLEMPSSEIKVMLDFPYIRKDYICLARVAEWYPKKEDTGDIAILELIQEPLETTKSAKLLMVDDYSDHPFSVYGCSKDFQKSGRWVDGKLQKILPNHRLQAAGISDTTYFIDSGFSGSPVWDDKLKGVIGIVVSMDRIEGKLQASIIPNNTIKTYYPSLPLIGHILVAYTPTDVNRFTMQIKERLEKDQVNIELMEISDSAAIETDSNVEEKLRKMGGLLLILSPEAVKSKSFERLWNDTLLVGKPIIPLLAVDCEIPSVLEVLNYLDFRQQSYFDQHVELLVSRLRGIDEEEKIELYERLSGLRVDASRNRPVVVGQRLTTTIDYFQNRVDQIKEIGQTLLMTGTRIVSVTGAGGIGKTALVSKFLYDLESGVWPHTNEGKRVDGILYLSHRTVGITLERLFHDCAELLGGEKKALLNSVWVSQKLSVAEKVDRLLTQINEGLYIILLDNIEDLLDSTGSIVDPDLSIFFQQSLVTPGNARLLVTSREPINFSHRDSPLDKRIILDEGLDIVHGVAMLRQADPSGLYGLKDAEEGTLAKIVNMVHGVPRALEIFVGIVKDEKSALLTLDEVIGQFFKHPMTEKELIIEGYRRLDDDAKKVIQGLAIFGRPVPVNAVNYLMEPFMPGVDIMSTVLRLIRIHMISVVDKNRKLIALHPMDRDYAYVQIQNGIV